jgi:hypothetical protein
MNNLASNMGLGLDLVRTGYNFKELSQEEKEDLIDKLETKKYEYSKSKTDATEIEKLLSTLKTQDVNLKIDADKLNRNALEQNFRREKTVLRLSDFNRIVDLTAPKAERAPDITTTLWKQQKSSTQDRAYRKDYDGESVRKFRAKMLCKPMTPQMKQELKTRQDNNVLKLDIHANRKELVAVKQYDPLTYTGLTLL